MLQDQTLSYKGKNLLVSVDFKIKIHPQSENKLMIASKLEINSFLYKGTYEAESQYEYANGKFMFEWHRWNGKKETASYFIRDNKLVINHGAEELVFDSTEKLVCGLGAYVFIANGILIDEQIEVATGKKIYYANQKRLAHVIKLSDLKGQAIELYLANNKVDRIQLELKSYLPSLTLHLVA